MDFCSVSLKLPLPIFLAFAMAVTAGAQQSAQPIIFSSSKSDDTAPATPSLAPQTAEQPNLADKFQAPAAGFNFDAASDAGQLPQMSANPSADNQRLQKILNERNNWALMTPEEIFGVTTPEKILGATERDAAGQEIKQTQLERWLARQESQDAVTNGWQKNAAPGSQDFSADPEADRFNPDGTEQENPRQSPDGFLDSAPGDASTSDGQNDGEGWQKSLGVTAPKINPEQQADMESFRQLLDSVSSATPQSSSGGKFGSTAATTFNSTLDQPAANPIGASFTSLSNGIVKPEGMSMLPGITGQNNPKPAAIPSWEPQPAPWLSQGPQLFVVPQRKF